MTSPRFTLHGMFPSGPVYKVALMLTLTGTPFNYTHIDLRAGSHKTEDFLGKNRFGQVPALEDHAKSITLCQSAVILDYLADELGAFTGKDHTERLRAREWQLWGAGPPSIGLYRTRGFKRGFVKFSDTVAESYLQMALTGLSELERLLIGRHWLVGNGPTLADLDIYGIVAYAGEAQIDLTPYPNVRHWMGHVESLKGFKDVQSLLPMQSVSA